jgi:cell division septum initiation protein DivIVA
MAKVYGVQPIPGVKDLFTLLDFLADSKAYEANLNAMIDVRDEIQVLIGRVGKADQIETLLVQAKEKFGEAENLRKRTELEADNLLAEAKLKAESVLVSARNLERANADGAEKLAKQVKAFEDNKAAIAAELQEQLQRANDLEIAALQAKVDAEDLKATYEAKLAKLKAATEE